MTAPDPAERARLVAKYGLSGAPAQVGSAAVDGLGSVLDSAFALADEYAQPAYGWADGETLRQRARRLVDERQRARDPLLWVDFTAGEMDLALLANGAPEAVAVLAVGEPYLGPTLLHAATPGLEYVLRQLPRQGGGTTDTVRVVLLHLLGIFDAVRSYLVHATAGDTENPADAANLAAILGGKYGNTRCDWRSHPTRGGTVQDMSLLVLPRGNRLLAWLCCSRCRAGLDRRYPGGLRWIDCRP